MTGSLPCILGLALAALLPAPASACPGALPAGLAAVTVGQGLVVDGMTLSVLQVRGRAPARTVLDAVAAAWRAAGHDVRRNRAAGWQIVAAGDDACLSTLQLTDRDGAFGYLAINRTGVRARAGAVHPALPLPLPPGATVLTTVASNDDGRAGTIAALTSTRTLAHMHGYYLHRLHADAWQAVSSQISLDRDRTPIGALVSARRGRERIEIVLWRDGATHAVINLAEAL